MKPRESWFVWSLHLIFGLLLGSGVGFMAAGLLVRYWLIDLGTVPVLCLAGSLLGGGFVSLKRNELWYGGSVFWEDVRELRPGSRICSRGLMVLGILLLAYVVLFKVRLLPDSYAAPKRSASTAVIAINVVATFSALWMGIYALREGTVFTAKNISVDRESSPFEYWFGVAFYWFIAVVGALRLVRYFVQ